MPRRTVPRWPRTATPVAPDAFPGITVQGTGKVTGTPDTLILTLTVSKTAGDVSSAMNDLSATMTAVQNSLSGEQGRRRGPEDVRAERRSAV